MTNSEHREVPIPTQGPLDDVQPSWKPFYWFVGILGTLVLLWEFFLELTLDIIENVWLILIEAPEELLEDLLTEWLKQHFPHDADYYAEISTAIGLTPLKLLLVFVLGRWLWRRGREEWFPRWLAWGRIQAHQVKLAWLELAWLYRTLAVIAFLALVTLLIEVHVLIGVTLFAVVVMAAVLVALI